MGVRRNRFPWDSETEVRFGSWLGENAKALDRYRRSYSSKTVSGIQFENTFDLEIELKNVILVAFRFFAFLHNQGHSRPKSTIQVTSAYPLRAEVQRTSLMVRFVPIPEVTSYSITSSARASSVGGTFRPSALAVVRLMTVSYFVGACTGRS